jgi:hypothetical protein
LSKFWKVSEAREISNNNERNITFGFDEMINDVYFYSKVLDGEESEENIFIKMKSLLDKEFL